MHADAIHMLYICVSESNPIRNKKQETNVNRKKFTLNFSDNLSQRKKKDVMKFESNYFACQQSLSEKEP
jgi:hypothetical protein